MAEDELRQLKKRFSELAERADKHCTWTETEFLNMAEQDALLSMRFAVPFFLDGGFDGAERRVAFFGSEEQTGYVCERCFTCIKIEPLSQKFAGQLTHRDILGAIMSLGIERKVTGDILIFDNIGYVFCLENIAEYICTNLTSVKHTSVKCGICAPPEKLNEPPKESNVVVVSERLDAVIAAVYKLSRSAVKELVLSGKVYANGRLVSSQGAVLPENCIVSVRGYGRFLYEGILRNTKKGKLSVCVRIY